MCLKLKLDGWLCQPEDETGLTEHRRETDTPHRAMVLRNPVGALKAEGLLHEADVHQLFSIAAAQR